MWDFLLVLGQVPGTHFQITFLDVLLAVGLVVLLWLLRKNIFLPLLAAFFLQVYGHKLKRGEQLKLPL